MITLSKKFAIAASMLVLLLQGCGKSDVTPDAAKSTTAPAPIVFLDSIAASDLVGSWNAGAGKGTIVAQPDGSLEVTNETKMVATSKITGGVLDAQEWKVTGRVSQDKKSLVWSNGAVWTK